MRRVLVANAEGDLADLFSAVMASHGWHAECVLDGLSAMERCLDDPPDLLLADARLPLLDGWGLAEGLRAAQARVPVVMLTERTGALEIEAALACDVRGLLPTAFTLPWLRSVCDQAMSPTVSDVAARERRHDDRRALNTPVSARDGRGTRDVMLLDVSRGRG